MIRSLLPLVCACLAAFAQSRGKDSKDAAEIPEIAYLDVTALNNNGQFAVGLTAADFTVSQAATPLKVVSAAPADPSRARILVMVVDDLGLSLEGLRKVRDALRKFVAEQVRPQDRIAIIRTGAGSGRFQKFTSDPVAMT